MRKKRNNPVLTSPWKIGVLVVLLLLITNAGVSYYLINQYSIDLKWLSSSGSVWGVDSFLFFKEAFPLAVGIIICSLLSYFVIASAVRRYKYYVDSGQDYRKMISLADSIDDLTNPAQIARLSNYPELQAILRNYGDKIKEISNEINMREELFDSAEFELEIDSLLDGKPVLQSVAEEKWWTGLVRKLDEAFRKKDIIVEKTTKVVDEERKKIGEVTLSFGKVIEYTNEAIENLSDIKSAMADAQEFLGNTDMGSVEGMQQADGDVKSALSKMNKSLKKLEEGGMAMHDFSESNNGLALNIALLAARGNIKESDLAGFAEKARGTAEQFNKLGNAVISLSRNLNDNYQTFKAWILNGSVKSGAGLQGAEKEVSQITSRVNKSREKLGNNLDNLKNDLESINLILQKSVKDKGENTLSTEEKYSKISENGEITDEIEQTAGGKESGSEDELIVSHGSAWDRTKLDKEASEPFMNNSLSLDNNSEEDQIETGKSGVSLNDFQKSVHLPDSSERKDLAPDIDKRMEDAGSTTGGNEETPDESWASLNVSRSGKETMPEDIDVEFKEKGIGDVKEDSKEEQESILGDEFVNDEPSRLEKRLDREQPREGDLSIEVAYRKHLDNSVIRQSETPLSDTVSKEENADDEEPIVDLFELGAVEIESAEARQ